MRGSAIGDARLGRGIEERGIVVLCHPLEFDNEISGDANRRRMTRDQEDQTRLG